MPKPNLTRRFYDRSPYPPRESARRKLWHLAPLAWMLAIDDLRPSPRRVLVAGCGTGAEVFRLQAALPDAEIVAVDFSARSIRIARQTQVKSQRHRARFVAADLTDPDFQKTVGAGFDFIVCHGVLSYV